MITKTLSTPGSAYDWCGTFGAREWACGGSEDELGSAMVFFDNGDVESAYVG